MSDQLDPKSERAVAEFLDVFARDSSRGATLPLEWYLERWPDQIEGIRSVYARLTGTSEAPRRLGHYRIDRLIGRGGAGSVYRAHDEKLSRTVALKVLGQRFDASPETMLRFSREITAAARLDRQDIVSIYDAGVIDGHAFIAMALIEGESLGEVFRRGNGSSDMMIIVEIVARVARALDAAHAAQIVHRDIKPANIVIDLDGRPVVLDFGLAGDLDNREGPQLSVTGDRVGTPAYMSPEQVRGERVDHKTDIWALGVILFEGLSGQRPFDGKTRTEIDRAILERSPRPMIFSGVAASRDLATVIAKTLEKEAHHRYATAGELADDLDNVLADRPVAARPTRLPAHWWRWARREPVRAALTGTGIIFVASLFWVGINWQSWREDRTELAVRRDLETRRAKVEDGLVKLTAGEIERAIKIFDSVLAEDHDDHAALALAAAHRGARHWEAMVEVLQRPDLKATLAASPYIVALLDRAQNTKRGQPISELDMPAPGSALGWLIRGYGAWNRGLEHDKTEHFEEAVRCYAAAARHPDGDSLPFYVARARGADACQDEAVAREVAGILEAQWPRTAVARYFAGHAMRRFDLERSVAEFRTAWRLEPDNSVYGRVCGATLLRNGDRDASLKVHREHVARHPDDALSLARLAECLLAIGELDEAEQQLAHAIRCDTSEFLVHWTLADLYDAREQPKAADKALRNAASRSQRNPDAHLRIMRLHQHPAKAHDALDIALESLRRWPENLNVADHATEVLFHCDRISETENALRKALQQWPHHAWFHIRLGRTIAKSIHRAEPIGTLSEAAEALEDGLAIDETIFVANKFLGATYAALKQPKRAVEFLYRALEQQPDETAIRVQYADQLLRIGKKKEAVTEAARAARDGKQHPHAHCVYANTLLHSNQIAKAHEQLDIAQRHPCTRRCHIALKKQLGALSSNESNAKKRVTAMLRTESIEKLSPKQRLQAARLAINEDLDRALAIYCPLLKEDPPRVPKGEMVFAAMALMKASGASHEDELEVAIAGAINHLATAPAMTVHRRAAVEQAMNSIARSSNQALNGLCRELKAELIATWKKLER